MLCTRTHGTAPFHQWCQVVVKPLALNAIPVTSRPRAVHVPPTVIVAGVPKDLIAWKGQSVGLILCTGVGRPTGTTTPTVLMYFLKRKKKKGLIVTLYPFLFVVVDNTFTFAHYYAHSFFAAVQFNVIINADLKFWK